MSEYVNYQDALEQLGMTEDELNELVADGKLRAFRDDDGNEVQFRADDIDGLRRSRETEPTIVLSDTQADALSTETDEYPIDLDAVSTEDTVLNIEGLLEDEAEGTTPIPGADLLEDETGLLEGEDEISVGGVGDDTVLDTDELDLGDDFDLTDDDTLLTDDDTLISGGSRRVQMVRKQSHGAMTGVLAAALVIALAPLALLVSLVNGDGGSYPFTSDSLLVSLSGLVEGLF